MPPCLRLFFFFLNLVGPAHDAGTFISEEDGK